MTSRDSQSIEKMDTGERSTRVGQDIEINDRNDRNETIDDRGHVNPITYRIISRV